MSREAPVLALSQRSLLLGRTGPCLGWEGSVWDTVSKPARPLFSWALLLLQLILGKRSLFFLTNALALVLALTSGSRPR